MYIYKFGCHSEEDSKYCELIHEEKYTQKQFDKILIDATVSLLTKYRKEYLWLCQEGEGEIPRYERIFFMNLLEKEDIYIKEQFEKSGLKTFDEFIEKEATRDYTQFSEICKEVGDLLVQKYGFKKVKYTAQTSVNGWGQIVKEDRNFGKGDKILDSIAKKYWKIINKEKKNAVLPNNSKK
jgi:hypothetical protein